MMFCLFVLHFVKITLWNSSKLRSDKYIMYGFLRPANGCQHASNDCGTYRKSYCGQCAALQQQFGYTSRAVVSYDTTLIGLLIAAQTPNPQTETTAWCAMFPRQVPVYRPDASAQQIAAALSMMLLYAKLQDSVQEKKSSFWKKGVLWLYQRKFMQAQQILTEAGFSSEAMTRLLAKQAIVEQRQGGCLQDYAEPSAEFSGEVFRFTAKVTNMPENEAILYQIGYHIGRIVYLADSCVDLADDKAKRQFNALLAAHLEGEQLQIQAQQIVVSLVQESLAALRELMGQLRLFHHQALIAEIILQGFPLQLQREIKQSLRVLQRRKLFVTDYLPHAALASALCLFANEANAIGWVWGEELMNSNNYTAKIYGFSFGVGENKTRYCIGLLDQLFNPFSYVVAISPNKPMFCSWFFSTICNMPKWIFVAHVVFHPAETQKQYNFKRIFIFVLSVATSIVTLWLAVQLIQQATETYQEYQTQMEVPSFIKKASPELSTKMTDISNMLLQADSEINRLIEIKNKYSRQTEVVQPRIERWQQTKTKLLGIQQQIELQTERAFVVYQVNQGSKDFEQVAQGLIKQADEALNMAKQIESAVQETR